MAEQPQGVRQSEKVRGKDIEGKVRVLEKTYPQQLMLFQTFLPEDASDDKYSNTIELYDAIPKYVTNPKLVDAMREGGKYLPLMKRHFRHRGEGYHVIIRPARLVDREGKEKEYYPGIREELVEDALRKLALEQFYGAYFDNQAGVQFTVYQLNKELQSLGHEFKRSSLVDALRICSGVLLTIAKEDGDLVMESPIFPLLLLRHKKDWVKHPKDTRCYVKFHPLVTQSISCLTYRQFDYASYMHYTHRLSRWLHKRLAHNYSQAGLLHPYTIRLSTILRDSGTHHSLRASNNVRQVEEALTELQERDIVMSLTRDVLRGPRHSLVDITYTLLPTMTFIEEVKKANRRVKLLSTKRFDRESSPHSG
jgi:hypothetical protein